MAKKQSKSNKSSKILWIEGRWVSNPNFLPILRKKGFEIETVDTGRAALKSISKQDFCLVVLDAASLRTSGRRICSSIQGLEKDLPVIVIATENADSNKVGDCANFFLPLPFTARKLINRINPLLPGDESAMVKEGPLVVDFDRNQVITNGKKTTLTPRLMKLLELLIEQKGTVIEREELFRKAWMTNYTGDTRTLDVHISWLRQAIEVDPKKPKVLCTIRGVGYRLDV